MGNGTATEPAAYSYGALALGLIFVTLLGLTLYRVTTGRIPALALTSFARSDRQAWQLLSDVHRDLPKPVEPAVLTAEVARAVLGTLEAKPV